MEVIMFYRIVKTGWVHMNKEDSLLYRQWKANGQVIHEHGNTVTFQQSIGSNKAVVIVFKK